MNSLYHYYQFLSRFDYAAFDPTLLRALPELARKRNIPLLARLFDDCPRLEVQEHEPRDLLLLS